MAHPRLVTLSSLALLALVAAAPAASAAETRAMAYCDDLRGGPEKCGVGLHSHRRECTESAAALPEVYVCDYSDVGSGSAGAGAMVDGIDPCPSPDLGDYCHGAYVLRTREDTPACTGYRYHVIVEKPGTDTGTSQCADERIQAGAAGPAPGALG